MSINREADRKASVLLTRPGRYGGRWVVVAVLLAGASGCLLPTKHRSGSDDAGAMPAVYEGQSLRSIGEQALDAGENALDAGRVSEARALFERSLWAFEYHLLLTGEEPPLLDAAREGLADCGGRSGNNDKGPSP